MSTLGSVQVYGPQLELRPKCTMIIKKDLLGNEANSNFTNGDVDASPLPFYLTEMPSVSLGADIETNNGAKLNQKLADFSEGNLLGISVGELVQNNATNGGGYVPSLVMGSSSMKIVKSAHKLNLSLKTRIMYDETINSCTHQPYNILLRCLMKLIMPTNGSKITTEHLETAFKNFVRGVGGTAGLATEEIKNLHVKEMKDTVVGIAGTWATAGKSLFAEEKDMAQIKQDMNNQIGEINKNMTVVQQDLTKMFDSLIKSYIYREYVELIFTRGPQNHTIDLFKGIVSSTENQNFKFIVKNFSVNQSNQLYGNTLYPIYMDFEISLESLGVIIKNTPASLEAG